MPGAVTSTKYMEANRFTPIEKIGRAALIKKIAAGFDRHSEKLSFGIGDDAAVLNAQSGSGHMLLSSEIYNEGVDFDLTYTPLTHLAYKVVSMAVSDIYAMNGEPEFLLVNLALTNKISVEMTEQFYEGIERACRDYNVQLAGGDIGAAHQAMAVSVTVTGRAETPVYRSGASNNDAICVTGDLGAASCGLMILLREKKHFETTDQTQLEPDLTPFEYVVGRQLAPSARADCIRAFRESGIVPGAMSDITKSLSTTLNEMMEASGKGCRIYEAAIPVSPETRSAADDLEEDIDKFVLYGGEDAELLFTLPEEQVKKFSENFRDFVVIGKVDPGLKDVKMQTAEGHTMTLT